MTRTPDRVCVVGSSNVDLTFYAAQLPAPGETRLGAEFRWGGGGKGANQAVAAARVGAETAFVTKVGDDFFGAHLKATYRREGLPAEFVLTDDQAATGAAAILVDGAGQNQILVASGANARLRPADVSAAAEAFAGARVVVCQLESPIETVVATLRAGRAAGAITMLNPAPAAPLPDEIWPLIDWLTPNELELAALSGATTTAGESLAEPSFSTVVAASRTLLKRGVGTVLTTLGARGALRVDATSAVHFPSVPVQPVDTTGAGDGFTGALAAGLAAGRPRDEAIGRASVVAAFSVTRPGAQASYPTQAEFERFLAEHPAPPVALVAE